MVPSETFRALFFIQITPRCSTTLQQGGDSIDINKSSFLQPMCTPGNLFHSAMVLTKKWFCDYIGLGTQFSYVENMVKSIWKVMRSFKVFSLLILVLSWNIWKNNFKPQFSQERGKQFHSISLFWFICSFIYFFVVSRALLKPALEVTCTFILIMALSHSTSAVYKCIFSV